MRSIFCIQVIEEFQVVVWLAMSEAAERSNKMWDESWPWGFHNVEITDHLGQNGFSGMMVTKKYTEVGNVRMGGDEMEPLKLWRSLENWDVR